MSKQLRRELVQFQDWIARMYPDLLETREDGVPREEKQLSRTVTFQVTDACSLACTYCYQIHKGTRRMSFDIAKLYVDKILSGEDGFKEYLGDSPAIILEFIGGEPFLEIELMDKIVDYFREQAILLNHPYAERFGISISSNGVAYRDEAVQRFLQKNRGLLSFSITVDGTKELHDSCRVFPDGRPSYDIAHEAALDWMAKGNYMGSKITLAPANVQYFSECMKQMVIDGYYDINANYVYEKGWEHEHALIIWDQCKQFTEWFIANDYDPYDFALSFFTEKHGYPKPAKDNDNWCGGTGLMLSCDPDGILFPCIRYMESSLGGDQPPYSIGDVWKGIMQTPEDIQRVKCLDCINRRSQSTDECFYCPVANGCAWCSAYNYQVYGTANKRAIYICEMHKVRALAITYYWNHIYEARGIKDSLDLWTPKQWAIPIIGEKDYEDLVALTKRLGGYINESATMIKDYEGEGSDKNGRNTCP